MTKRTAVKHWSHHHHLYIIYLSGSTDRVHYYQMMAHTDASPSSQVNRISGFNVQNVQASTSFTSLLKMKMVTHGCTLTAGFLASKFGCVGNNSRPKTSSEVPYMHQRDHTYNG